MQDASPPTIGERDFKVEPSPKEAEAAKLFESAQQVQLKVVFFLVAGAVTILGFSIQTAVASPVAGTIYLLVASWIAFLGSALCGFRWLELEWMQSNVNHKRVDLLAQIEKAINTAQSKGELTNATTGETISPQAVIDTARRGLQQLKKQDDINRNKGNTAYRFQRSLLVLALVLYAGFYVWNTLGLPGIATQAGGQGRDLLADSRWFSVVGLAVDIAGAFFLAYGLIISKKRAIEVGGTYFMGDADEVTLKIPPVADRVRQSRNAVIGLALLVIGCALQLVGTWPR